MSTRVQLLGAADASSYGNRLRVHVVEQYLEDATLVQDGPEAIISVGGQLEELDVPDARVRLATSVGVARSPQSIDSLHGFDFIGVRDRASSGVLTALGIEHELVPDVLHALAFTHPGPRGRAPDAVVFEAPATMLVKLAPPRVAARLAAAEQLRAGPLLLLVGGPDTNGDTLLEYKTIAARLRRQAPDLTVEIVPTPDPRDTLDAVREARAVISGSPYLRVAAAAYGVPRISLARPRATRYARTWDRQMPHDVDVDDLDEAIATALEIGTRPAVEAQTRRLTTAADVHLRELASRVGTL